MGHLLELTVGFNGDGRYCIPMFPKHSGNDIT